MCPSPRENRKSEDGDFCTQRECTSQKVQVRRQLSAALLGMHPQDLFSREAARVSGTRASLEPRHHTSSPSGFGITIPGSCSLSHRKSALLSSEEEDLSFGLRRRFWG